MIELMDYVQPPQVNKQAFDPIQIIKESAELASARSKQVRV